MLVINVLINSRIGLAFKRAELIRREVTANADASPAHPSNREQPGGIIIRVDVSRFTTVEPYRVILVPSATEPLADYEGTVVETVEATEYVCRLDTAQVNRIDRTRHDLGG